jgi:phage gpG-like protein
MIRFNLDTSEVDAYLEFLKQKGYRTRSILRTLGTIMLKGVDRNFEEEGRPIRWKPLKDITLELRKGVKRGRGRPVAGDIKRILGTSTKGYGTKPLQRTGRLKDSIKLRLFPNRVEIYTDVPYARIQHDGGSIINHLGQKASVDKRPFLSVTDISTGPPSSPPSSSF